MSVAEVNEKNFEKQVLKSSVPVIVDIWAEWCGPCKQYAPTIEEVSKDYDDKIRFVKIDADESQEMLEKYDMSVTSIPTTLFVENGTIKDMLHGAVSKDVLKKWIKENL